MENIAEDTVNRGVMILNLLNIVCNGFTNISLGESLKPSLFPIWTHAPAPHQAQILCSVYTPHLSSLPFCKHAADIWKNYGVHPCYGFLLIIAFCPPRLQELLTAWAGDYLHSFAAPLHHTMACNVQWGFIFVCFFHPFSSIFGLLISCRLCLLPFFLCLVRCHQRSALERGGGQRCHLDCDVILSQPVG